jgi:two-component system, NarL family, response regulator DevR
MPATTGNIMSSQPIEKLEPVHRRNDSGPPDQPVSVLIVDDHPAVRAGVERVLADEADIAPVAIVATARDALAEVQRLSPRVAVVDYHLPDRDGLSLTRQLKALPRPPAVLIYSAFADARITVGAIVAGADGVANKNCRADELCAAVRAIANGSSSLPAVPPDVISAIAAELDVDDLPILGMLMNGTPPAELADVLGVTTEWLEMRRWAILQAVAGRRGRRPRAAAWTTGRLRGAGLIGTERS